ncbi:MAG: M23 family metallopeptidase, partial [Clostridia bacterium]|nr:M23 family metallopeptidase [Clostridia bacterium]
AGRPVIPGGTSSRTRLEVTTPAATYRATAEEDPDGLWKTLETARKNASSISSIPDSAVSESLLAVYITHKYETDASGEEVLSGTEQTQFIFYFSTDYSACYFKDPSGNQFRIRDNDAKEFLALDASAYLFKGGTAPVLTVAGTAVEPASMKCNYLAAGNTYRQIEKTSDEKKVLTSASGGKVDLQFSEAPTSCIIRIYNGSAVYYDGSYLGNPPLSFTRNTKVEYVLKATWSSSEAGNGKPYGEASYSFEIDVRAPVVFAIGSESIRLGDFTVLAAFNATDPSEIGFSSTPTLPCTPVFYRTDDNTCMALLPVSYGSAAGTYAITLSAGEERRTLMLEVRDWLYGYKATTYDVSKAMIDALYTKDNLDALKKLENEITAAATSNAVFSGVFQGYQIKDILLGIGRSVKLTNDSQNPQRSFEHSGVDVKATAGTAVKAMNTGTVCAAGKNEILGNYVVIDHGIGLLSWYAHLGDVSVSKGDSVAAGQTIAYAGSSGFTKPDRIHVGFSVAGISVAPYGLWEKEVKFPVFTN